MIFEISYKITLALLLKQNTKTFNQYNKQLADSYNDYQCGDLETANQRLLWIQQRLIECEEFNSIF